MATRKKTTNFEDSLNELEQIVEALETGGLSLDESLKAFEKGVRITKDCQQALDKAEQKVSVLTRDSNGEISAAPLDEADDQ